MRSSSRKVHLAVFTASLSALALVGCGSGHGGSASARFSLAIYDVGYPNTPLTCDEVAGADVAVFLNGSQTDFGDVVCTNTASYPYLTLTTEYVPSGTYTVDFYLYGNSTVYGNTSTIIGSSRLDNVRLLAGDTDFSATETPIWVQTVVVDWTILNTANRTVTCAAGETVQLEFAQHNTNKWIVTRFPCSANPGASFPIPLDYTSLDWSLYLMSGGNDEDGIDSSQPVGVQDNYDVNLGTQTFYVP
jgi:hypothetical protein